MHKSGCLSRNVAQNRRQNVGKDPQDIGYMHKNKCKLQKRYDENNSKTIQLLLKICLYFLAQK